VRLGPGVQVVWNMDGKDKRLWIEERVAAPLCQSPGVVEVADLVIGEKAMVLKNVGSQYYMEVANFTKNNTLPTFSLIFNEFKNEGFLFNTTWQWKVGTRRVCASIVWDLPTLVMFDLKVPTTIYAKKKKGIHEASRFFN
jgi:hypothetical protein